MKIRINGDTHIFEAPLSLAGMLGRTGHAEMLVAVARNNTFVPKALYDTTFLEDGDAIEIVAPMQGG